MSEADEKARAVSRYFQARPTSASAKNPDVRKMALLAWRAYSRPDPVQRTSRAPKPHSKDMPPSITDTGLGHSTKKAATNATDRIMSKEAPKILGRWPITLMGKPYGISPHF